MGTPFGVVVIVTGDIAAGIGVTADSAAGDYRYETFAHAGV
jgi:hypothetical protein